MRDGILKHSKGYGKIIPDDPQEMAATYEGRIVRIADIMAYLNHDLDDAIRSGVIRADQTPDVCLQTLGASHSERATAMIRDLVFTSKTDNGELHLNMSNEVYDAMTTLREFLYENVYRSPQVHMEFVKAKKILSELYTYFLDNQEMVKKELANKEMSACLKNGDPIERTVCDLIASMTDRYALRLYERIFFPAPQV